MKTADRFLKIVEWSDEDQCYVGRCPGLMLGGIHGEDEEEVYRELRQAVEEWIGIYTEDGVPLPKATAGKRYSGKFLLRIGEELHQRLFLKALSEGESLNQYCRKQLEKAL